MTLDRPISYAEWYWKYSVEAVRTRAEDIESVLSPIAAQINETFTDVAGLPPFVSTLLGNLASPKDPSWDEMLVGYAGSALSKVTDFVFNGKLREVDYGLNQKLQNVRIDPNVANILRARKRIPIDIWQDRQEIAGYHPAEAEFIYESQMPYYTIDDVIRFARYYGDAANPKSVVEEIADIPIKDWPVWEWLSRQHLNTEQVMSLLKYGFWDGFTADTELQRLGWVGDNLRHIKDIAYETPNAMILLQGGLMGEYSNEYVKALILRGGIHENFQDLYYDAVLSKPATQDIIAYSLRHDPSLTNLSTELRRIGVHPNYHGLYKELAYQIPPVQDIITMAVREAFTPAIASRFGQYEDLPTQFVDWAQKKGLTKDWAERYWAAHWSLPSPQQGYEMLHRGVISEGDLNLLLRASDVMPFWRDKLIQIAYRPLTRVDVRRMYNLGILDRNGVNKAYRDLGYNDHNAELMTQFTVKSYSDKPKRMSTTKVVTAYKNWLINDGTASSILREIGIESAEVNTILQDARHEREWKYKDEQLAAIANLYKKGKRSEEDTRTELAKLGLPTEYVQTLLDQWAAKAEAERETLWTTAQTLSFVKSGLITAERANKELTSLGYDKEHRDIYIKSATTQTE